MGDRAPARLSLCIGRSCGSASFVGRPGTPLAVPDALDAGCILVIGMDAVVDATLSATLVGATDWAVSIPENYFLATKLIVESIARHQSKQTVWAHASVHYESDRIATEQANPPCSTMSRSGAD